MKKKAILQTEPKEAVNKGKRVTAQALGQLVILNYWYGKKLAGRYAMDTETLEFASYDVADAEWSRKRFNSLLGYNPFRGYSRPSHDGIEMDTKEDETLLRGRLEANKRLWCHDKDIFDLLERAEQEYNSDRRERQEQGRIKKLNDWMAGLPDMPAGIQEWAAGIAAKDKDFMIWDKEAGGWQCTSCGGKYSDKSLKEKAGNKKVVHNDRIWCPGCGKEVQAKKRTKGVKEPFHFYLIQDVDEETAVERCFDGEFIWAGGRHYLTGSESMRVVLYRSGKYVCRLYYNQYTASEERRWEPGYEEAAEGFRARYASFDKGNRANRRSRVGYLYPGGIVEGLKGTYYEPYTRTFSQMAALGAKAQYNKLLAAAGYPGWEGILHMAEYLAKGRFSRLLGEATDNISFYYHDYRGRLSAGGRSMEEVFRIRDRQKINRVRDEDGGEQMVGWMQWSDRTGEKVSREALVWLEAQNLNPRDVDTLGQLAAGLSIQQIMNYIKRQQAESYQEKSGREVLNQWGDYLKMCQELGKDLSDEMVYRPRELKRRHDEAVQEIALRQEEVTAEDYRRRFPGVEEVLSGIRGKYSYRGENYLIKVPQTCVEIVAEGRALHHCAGSSDRYFDRIRQRETYICFLRKVSEPDTPYYTIEVEPGGTIRQHRGYLDEEPEIEQIRPFLREWQQAIRKRMDQEEEQYARISAVKREENIEELKAKNNTRVLEGLMQDFMEAV